MVKKTLSKYIIVRMIKIQKLTANYNFVNKFRLFDGKLLTYLEFKRIVNFQKIFLLFIYILS